MGGVSQPFKQIPWHQGERGSQVVSCYLKKEECFFFCYDGRGLFYSNQKNNLLSHVGVSAVQLLYFPHSFQSGLRCYGEQVWLINAF